MDDPTEDNILPSTKPAESEMSGFSGNDQPGISSPAPDPRAEKEVLFLEERIRALRHEVDKLIEQRPLLLAALRYQHIGDVMKIAIQGMFAIIGFVVVVGLIAAIWSAAHDDGLVIEAFSVPPDLAQRGLTGQVVASQLLDKLATIQDNTPTARAASTYSNNWGNDIKVSIPNTGVSVEDVNRLLRDSLGHETHITGDVYRTATSIAITARTGGESGATSQGPEAGFDSLLQKSAEAIYRRTQPYRYAVYLEAQQRSDESDAVLRALLDYGPSSEAKWAHLGLANNMENNEKFRETVSEAHAALADDPAFGMAYAMLADGEGNLGHDEAALAALDKGMPLLEPGRDSQVTARAAAILHARMDAQRSAALGDFRAAADTAFVASKLPDYHHYAGLARIMRVEAMALAHDGAADAANAALSLPSSAIQVSEFAAAMQLVPTALEHWPDAAGTSEAVVKTIRTFGDPNHQAYVPLDAWVRAGLPCRYLPMAALAWAHEGDTPRADNLIAQTPSDCYYAVRVRGEIAGVEHRWSDGARWFADAVAQAPSIPFAYAEWGRMLVAEGDLDGGLAKFEVAHSKGPRFADPLEMWGEILVRKNRSDLALTKFEEAGQYAPHWGHLHLKWGEALFYVGRNAEAKRQFTTAVLCNLSDDDKAELSKVSRAHS